jgi:hypothetical protein
VPTCCEIAARRLYLGLPLATAEEDAARYLMTLTNRIVQAYRVRKMPANNLDGMAFPERSAARKQ